MLLSIILAIFTFMIVDYIDDNMDFDIPLLVGIVLIVSQPAGFSAAVTIALIIYLNKYIDKKFETHWHQDSKKKFSKYFDEIISNFLK